jgi:hypothetical protein
MPHTIAKTLTTESPTAIQKSMTGTLYPFALPSGTTLGPYPEGESS